MSTVSTVVRGLARATAAPRLIGLIWLVLALFALPGGVAMERTIRADIERSLVQNDLQADLELGWLEEFRARRGKIAMTLTPAHVSGVAVFANLEAWFSARWSPSSSTYSLNSGRLDCTKESSDWL